METGTETDTAGGRVTQYTVIAINEPLSSSDASYYSMQIEIDGCASFEDAIQHFIGSGAGDDEGFGDCDPVRIDTGTELVIHAQHAIFYVLDNHGHYATFACPGGVS